MQHNGMDHIKKHLIDFITKKLYYNFSMIKYHKPAGTDLLTMNTVVRKMSKAL